MSAPKAEEAREAIRSLAASLDQLPNEALQEVLGCAIRAYAQRAGQIAPSERPSPFSEPGAVTPTDVVIAVTEMLKAVDVEVFELGMWQAWGNT